MRPFIMVCSRLLVCFLLGLATAGCGGDPEMTCYGCYASGVCISGTEATGCGAGGGECVVCGAAEKCQAGRCVSGSCPGCVDGAGSCRAGRSAEACGSAGTACLTCKAAESCLGGTCQTACNIQLCPTGCCTAGKCAPGTSGSACGSKAAPCTACSASETCEQGECVDKKLGCSGCQGCCSNDACLAGDKAGACGKGGAACQTCPTNHSCVEGTCKPNPAPCDSTTCSGGCCTSSNLCLPFSAQNETQCGTEGGPCSVCGSSATCQQGTCVEDQPCFSFCKQGCCTNEGVCVGYTDQDKTGCGDGGDLCAACEASKNCLTGACVNDPVWDVWAISAVIEESKPDGSGWDSWPANALPDPYLSLCLGNVSLCWSHDSNSIGDTVTPFWNQKVASWTETELLAQGLTLWVMDDDNLSGTFNNEIGKCLVTITSAALQAGQLTISGCGSASQVKLSFVQQ